MRRSTMRNTANVIPILRHLLQPAKRWYFSIAKTVASALPDGPMRLFLAKVDFNPICELEFLDSILRWARSVTRRDWKNLNKAWKRSFCSYLIVMAAACVSSSCWLNRLRKFPIDSEDSRLHWFSAWWPQESSRQAIVPGKQVRSGSAGKQSKESVIGTQSCEWYKVYEGMQEETGPRNSNRLLLKYS